MVIDIPSTFRSAEPRADITGPDRELLRSLAGRLAELSTLPVQEERADLWRRINRLERVRPPIVFHPWETIWNEILPEGSIVTSSPEAQYYETVLRRRLWIAEHLDDDTVVAPFIEYPMVLDDVWVGIGDIQFAALHETGAQHWDPCIVEPDDIYKIVTHPEISLNCEATELNRQQAEGLFGGVIEVRPDKGTGSYGSSFFDTWVMLRGMQNVFMDLVTEPEWTHEGMDRLVQNIENRILSLERQGLLQLNNGIEYCYNGGMSITDQLPAPDFDGRHVRPKDLWGFSTAQSAVAISPEMHDQFVIPYEKRLLEGFGLNALACCEPMDDRIDLVRGIPNLRRISMSEWVDPVKGAQALGKDFIYSWKPDTRVHFTNWHPDWERSYLRNVLEHTRECVVEIAQLAVNTCRGEVNRLIEWTRIAREEAMRIEGA